MHGEIMPLKPNISNLLVNTMLLCARRFAFQETDGNTSKTSLLTHPVGSS